MRREKSIGSSTCSRLIYEKNASKVHSILPETKPPPIVSCTLATVVKVLSSDITHRPEHFATLGFIAKDIATMGIGIQVKMSVAV